MAAIDFYAGTQNLNSSGVGFYGSSFAASIPVSSWNSRTFITNSNGTLEGPEGNNIKWTHANSGIIGSTGSSVVLTRIPNYLSTLNIRFTHSSGVQTSNATLYIYDRTSINNGPSGVTCKVAEVIHTDTVQNNNGSGDTSWITAAGTGTTVSFVGSPGTSGLSPSGTSTIDSRHDWYAAISASPDSVGSKTNFGLYFSCEYI